MGFDHDEPSELICNRSIKDLAVAQQFHSSTGRSRASDNCVTRSPNERKANAGMITSPMSGEPGETVGGSAFARAADPSSPTSAVGATAAAVVAALVSTDGCVS
jgi:hypothetical protein